MFSHYPLLLMAESFRPESVLLAILSILLVAIVMAAVWGCLIYLGCGLATRALACLGISKRQNLVIGYSFGALFVTALALVIIDFFHNTPTPFAFSPEVKSVVDGNSAFALDLYQKLKERPGNLFFSPYGISTSLAMLYAGARQQTEREMAKTLHFSLPQSKLHVAFGELTTRMEKVRRWSRITLMTANSLWCQQGDPFKDSFLSVVRTHYKAEARLVDFGHTAQAASDEINAWVEKKTKGRIKGMVEPGQLTRDTSLVLCNAIYFKGEWATQFKPGDTKPAPFFITTNQTVSVHMMHQSSEFKMAHIDDGTVQLLELPYYGRDLSMIILLPEAVDGLPDIERQLTAANLHTWLAKLDQTEGHKTHVSLPRFTTTQSIELTNVLQSLGITTAFDRAAANFSGIDGINMLYLSDAIHEAFVEVNEQGTEAAAATMFQAKSRSMSGHFNADHPFIFLIRENGSGSILFIGRIVDPTK